MLKPLVVTGINKSAMERLPGDRDGEIDFSAWFNPSAGQEHATLKALPLTDVQVSYFRGTAVGNAAASCIAKQVDYKTKRGADGSLSLDVNAMANAFGLEWGNQLTAGIRTDTIATNGTGIASGTGASTAFGFQAYLHVFTFIGTSVTIKLQESNDNGGSDPYADTTNGSFGVITAPGIVRIAAPNNQAVKQWVRLITTGTFSNSAFAASFCRNYAAVVF